MPPPNTPVVLQLAPLPRTQIGPFLILGVDKDASKEVIEAAWAEKIKQARRGAIKTPLEDINWAREMLSSKESRIRCDAVAFNVDTTDGTLKKLKERYQGKTQVEVRCKPIDTEKWLADYVPPTPVPTVEEIRGIVQIPEIPREVPAVRVMLEDFVEERIDPWKVELDA
ncbi:MAG: hypothetical protein FJ303_12170 [Planctomycetes bacterium]|nr:hypothetical protein [Planctomycetota bacterium]